MDDKLLTLWRHFPSGNISTVEISKTLQLSPKQSGRYLKKWDEEGWFTFTPGRGRGNVSKLKWIKDVEVIFEEKALKRIDQEPVERSSRYLMYDWSTDSKLRLMNKFQTKLGFVQESQDKLIVPKRYPFFSVHPLQAADVLSAHLVANVFNRMVSLTETGEIVPELAHSWDSSPSMLRLYLKKDIKFHDGSLFTAKDAAVCLEKLRLHHHYKEIWDPVERIEVKTPLILDIHYPGGCSYILPLLSMMCASMYRETREGILGTGCFSLEVNKPEKTTLAAFKDYFQERPLLDTVEFIQVPHEFRGIYHSPVEQDQSFEVESDSGFGIVVMNTCRQSDIRRKEVRQYLHWVINKNIKTIGDCSPRLTPNNKSIMAGKNHELTMGEVDRPEFKRPIVIRGVNYTASTTQWLADIFEKENIPVEIQWFSFADTLNREVQTLDVDLFIHGEIFESNQDFSFYYFLKNGYSPLHQIVRDNQELNLLLEKYPHIPFEEWDALNMQLERKLIEQSIMIPLYYEKRFIPFSSDIMNIKIKHFGYVDFSKLWVRPRV
ncbi:ABC transporter substrate-binding protein [Rossellomorea aquimaris]|uniref:ABC transporter substrate-binding protein n=1 Tax=Rossellomorea aquimaris TaxID=189382 RepID=A0A5D4TXI0_9BACI|nr:ABC transporter substrate-binding protein [Rossellomorea aquimaris]TYS79703.1 ABC transporter substrate-binding protein [Rossellomorea aquimaris]